MAFANPRQNGINQFIEFRCNTAVLGSRKWLRYSYMSKMAKQISKMTTEKSRDSSQSIRYEMKGRSCVPQTFSAMCWMDTKFVWQEHRTLCGISRVPVHKKFATCRRWYHKNKRETCWACYKYRGYSQASCCSLAFAA